MICRKCKKEIPDESIFCLYCGADQSPAPSKKRRRSVRARGTGSVYKLPGKRMKPWVALRQAVKDEDGNILRKCIGTYATEAEAEQAVAEDRILPTSEYAGLTLKGLFDLWKETRAYTDLSKQTRDNYKAAFAYLEDFHNTKFSELRTAHFQRAIDNANKKGKSRSTMEKIKALCTILSKYAYSQDIVYKTYADGIRLPKEQKRKAPQTFSETEISTLFKHQNVPMVDTILILIYTGMRITELLQLTKFDIDIKAMLITGGVKTEAGEDRTIPVHPKIQDLIRARYDSASNYLIEEEVEAGNKKKGTSCLVLKRFQYEHYCDLYYAVLDQLGIRRLTPHKARHTFFSRLDARCKDKWAIAKIGGHTDSNFTEKVYVHPDIDRLRDAMNCL